MVDEQLDKLLYSIKRFQEDLKKGNKRAAIGDLHYVEDRAKSIRYLLLAELEADGEVNGVIK